MTGNYSVVKQTNDFGQVRYKIRSPHGGFCRYMPIMSTSADYKDRTYRFRFHAETQANYWNREKQIDSWRDT